MEGNFTVDAHIVHNCNKGIDYVLNSEYEIAEAGIYVKADENNKDLSMIMYLQV